MKPFLWFPLLILSTVPTARPPREVSRSESLVQLCTEYSGSGDLLKATVSAHSFSISITRPNGQTVKLTGDLGDSIPISNQWQNLPKSPPIPCQFAVSKSSKIAALAMAVKGGPSIPPPLIAFSGGETLLALLDLAAGKITHLVHVPAALPIHFDLHPIGFIRDSETLALSQAHYLASGEPEIATQLISAEGSITRVPHTVTGPNGAEISSSSFDFRDARVWFLCPVVSARIDRQPRCTLTSASLLDSNSDAREIPPPPDDRVIGSGQPDLGFPSPNLAVVLAARRFWLYNFGDQSFHQLNLPETPHHINWFEFPGQPKFSSDGRFVAVPVEMSHFPLFVEGQALHGTKLLIVELRSLRIVETIQPIDKRELIDFALHSDGTNLSLVANWGSDWRDFRFPVTQ